MLLQVGLPGRIAYDRALAWQEALVSQRVRGGGDALLLLEHPPVYTLGRGADRRHLGLAATGDVPIVETHRGGEVTFHGPGQLVGYPVLGLRDRRPDLHWYLRTLEDLVIDTLAELGIESGRVVGKTGVWVEGRRKICSIGVAVRRWVTWHGFALNVGADLSGFASITPCGLAGVEMTSVASEGGPAEVPVVLPVVLERFLRAFGYEGWEPMAVPAEVAA